MRRPETQDRIAANNRYIERKLGQLHLGQRVASDLLHTERLRAAFTSELPAGGNDRIGQLRCVGVSGRSLRDALANWKTGWHQPSHRQLSQPRRLAATG